MPMVDVIRDHDNVTFVVALVSAISRAVLAGLKRAERLAAPHVKTRHVAIVRNR
jgi:hypothetical protein